MRNHKVIHITKTTVNADGGITVDIDHQWASGQMMGKVDKGAGTVIMTDNTLVFKGYLKSRNFKLVGYNLDVRFTNINS